MNKKLTVALAAAALSVSMAVPAMAQWNAVGSNWQWIENGTAVKDTWVTTANGQYYINLDGWASVNWINWNGNWYFGEQGANAGNVLKNTWATIDGKVYYFGETGVMATGAQTVGGTAYSFDANGACTTTPSGVQMVTINTVAYKTTGSVSSGGSSGGGSSSSHVTPSADKVAQKLQDQAVLDAAGKALAGKVGAESVTVTAEVDESKNMFVAVETAAVKKDAKAYDLVNNSYRTALSSAGLVQSDITSINGKSFSAYMSAAQALLGDKTVAEALADGSVDTERTAEVTVGSGDSAYQINVEFAFTLAE